MTLSERLLCFVTLSTCALFRAFALSGLLLLMFDVSKASNLAFESLSVSDGLANNTIWSIEQDETGYIWFATSRGLSRYNGYDVETFFHSNEDPDSISSDRAMALHLDRHGRLWIGTSDAGLNHYHEGLFKRYRHDEEKPQSLGSNKVSAITSNQNGLWVGTDKGVNYQPVSDESFRRFDLAALYGSSGSNNVYCLYTMADESVLVGTSGGLYKFHASASRHEKLDVSFPDKNLKIRSLLQLKNRLFIGTNENLYVYDLTSKTLSTLQNTFENIIVLSLREHGGDIWIGSFRKGILRIKSDGSIENYTHSKYNNSSPSGDISLSLLIDRHSNLWSGSFDSGVNKAYLLSERFSRFESKLFADECGVDGDIRSIFEDKNNDLWFSSDQKYIHFDQKTQSCQTLNVPQLPHQASYYFRVHQTFIDSSGQHWVASTLGLFKLSPDRVSLIHVQIDTTHPIVLAIGEVASGELSIGTSKGVYTLNTETLEATKVIAAPSLETSIDDAFVSSFHNFSGSLWFATDRGLAKIESKNITPWLHKESKGLLAKHVYALLVRDEHFFAALADGHIYKFDHNGLLLYRYQVNPGGMPVYPWDILLDDQNNRLWVSSSNGLFRIDLNSGKSVRFTTLDGLRGNVFAQGAVHKSSEGRFYFGGKKGLTAFYPEEMSSDSLAPTVVINKFTRFNEPVTPGNDYEGLSIGRSIEYLNELELSHRDYVVGFEFAGLHLADPTRNRYAYKLQGLHDQWQFVDASRRKVTFTNLAAGEYVFSVKASNKDGVWSEASDTASLKIYVKPAPWLSWWAMILYSLAVFLSVWWFVHHRTRSAIKRSQELEVEVVERTQEINSQKMVIEDLLARKDELFANISHEFRTPLTLILGPLEKELSQIDAPEERRRFEMMRRNANRLLSMVEQILMLTELKSELPAEKYSQSVIPILEAVIASFRPLAQRKEIAINLISSQACSVLVSRDALEIMSGNLISNAIKYTPQGGSIDISVLQQGIHIDIVVADTGVGIPKSAQESVFERFVRLEGTKGVSGTGIGLSIVKELVQSHQGTITVKSREPLGTEFKISLPATTPVASTGDIASQAISHLTQMDLSTPNLADTNEFEIAQSDRSDTVLIIEDNADMQTYIESVLKQGYHCLTASSGEDGLSLAFEQVPDLIICDVMMPGIDGFEVARKLREDDRTCHIPIVLLTAKGDKESRIKGWNENIDDYMSKPFDEAELTSRIRNILAIRNIVRRQLNISLQSGQLPEIPSITQQDQKFLDKLSRVIDKHFINPEFTRSFMASEMAVSERQLQRKLKALIDSNPMDFLRDYRLEKSAELLAQGKQVTSVAYDCGFSSSSHYTRCFKAKFGITPKQYQKKDGPRR